MKDKLISANSTYFIHLIYASTFLLITIIVISYLIWNQNQKHTLADIKKAKINICLSEVLNEYNAEWASACNNTAKSSRIALDHCTNEAASFVRYMKTSYTTESDTRNLYNLKVAQCKSIYGTRDPSPTCMLPKAAANEINNRLNKNEELCNSVD